MYSRAFNLLLLLFLAFMLYQRVPDILHHFQAEGAIAPEFQVDVLEGRIIKSNEINRPMVLVFWATWCGPCQIELSRINKMILANEIQGDSVLAISSGEDLNLLRQTVQERGYKFLIGTDDTGKISSLFQVSVTPSIVFLSSEHKTEWMTSGLSPLLDFRIKQFLKN